MKKLDQYLKTNKIPNILFHGPLGSGKKTLLFNFIKKIYPDKTVREQQVMSVNCAFGKGIKFIREDVKYFSKINTHCNFKSVILLNAEKLTPDAQFALRRCIEQFNYNTRFFIVTSDKYKLMKPILSRFSEMYISTLINYNDAILQNAYPFNQYNAVRMIRLDTIMSTLTQETITLSSNVLYQEAYSAKNIEQYVENQDISTVEKYTWLMYSSKICAECKNEALLLYILLYFYVYRSDKLYLFM